MRQQKSPSECSAGLRCLAARPSALLAAIEPEAPLGGVAIDLHKSRAKLRLTRKATGVIIHIMYAIPVRDEPYYTVPQLARRYRVSERTIHVWLEKGEFPNRYRLRARSPYRVPESDVLAFDRIGSDTKIGERVVSEGEMRA